ncbi:MAG: PEP-CTERM sorting domain-containing protein [Planctomycetes bacterium]|nr:PEP-CTERM sorting domain-containing protein [Planctomycetota bacterium]
MSDGLPTLIDNMTLEVPEPASLAMFAMAGLFMLPIRRRRRREL